MYIIFEHVQLYVLYVLCPTQLIIKRDMYRFNYFELYNK